jgi:hypothetical protein
VVGLKFPSIRVFFTYEQFRVEFRRTLNETEWCAKKMMNVKSARASLWLLASSLAVKKYSIQLGYSLLLFWLVLSLFNFLISVKSSNY